MARRRCARASPAIRGEIPRLYRGGSNSLTDPALCFTTLHLQGGVRIAASRSCGVRLLIGCDQAPLRGQQR